MGLQTDLFPRRVTVRMRRRLAYSATLVRWRRECLTGSVLRQWRDAAIVAFDGRKRDGSARGCVVLVAPMVLPRLFAAPAETLLEGAMRGRP